MKYNQFFLQISINALPALPAPVPRVQVDTQSSISSQYNQYLDTIHMGTDQ